MKKLVVFDLDGTIADLGKGVTEEDTALLKEIHDQGMRIAICSGKTTYYLCGFARQLGVPDIILIGENGSTIQFGIDLPPKIFSTLPYPKKVKRALEQIKHDIEEMYPSMWFQPNQVMVTPFPENEMEFERIEQYFANHKDLLEGIVVFRHVDSFDILPVGMTKCEGLGKLSEMTGIAADEMIAVGNGVNDVPMFQYAGLSIAVNFPEEKSADIHFENITDALKYISAGVQSPTEI